MGTILYIFIPGLVTIVVGLCFALGFDENIDSFAGKFLIVLGSAITSFFVNQGLHYMVENNTKADSYKVTIEKEDVTEAYQVTSYSIDGDTVKLVFEGGNVEYYVLKKGEKVKCQY